MDRGRGLPFEGNYTSWLEQKQARLAQEEKIESKRQKFLKQELEWVRMSPKAQMAKNKARMQRYDELASQQYDARDDAANIQIPVSRPLGKLVLKAEGLKKAFGDKLLFENLTFELPRGGIVGVIGPNGAGKTTLFRMIMGLEQPDAGTLTLGPSVDLAYVDQTRDELDGKKSVYEEISGGRDHLEIGAARIHARSYCNRFNFKGSDQQKFVGDLSGGERNRVHLAKLLRSGGNLIILDEPTNDLDVDTLRSLEEGLAGFGGCAVVSSHDRWFLDRLATHIIAFEGNSQVTFFEGNYKMYDLNRKERLGMDADQPHRIKYRPL
jgi:ATPase subunit of ABC transporter with duplicated ATPase domains